MIRLVRVKAIIRKKDTAELLYVKANRDIFCGTSDIKVVGEGVVEWFGFEEYDWTPADF